MKYRLLSNVEYRAFRKTHPDLFALEIEEGKIEREKQVFACYRERGTRLLKHRLRRMSRAEIDELAAESELEIERIALRQLHNAHHHKRRLHGLEHREE